MSDTTHKLGLSADEVLTTTRSVRKRLDFDRPVPDDLLRECVEIAVQAPTGSNMQGWHFMFVTERDKIAAIAELYKRGFDAYRNSPMFASRVAADAGDARVAQQARVASSAEYLADNMHRSPVLFLPCITTRTDDPRALMGQAASIIPAAWSFMLAARERQLGTCWTSLHLGYEREAADVLDIPFDEVRQYGLSPVAFTQGTSFKLATRTDLDSVISFNNWSR